MAKVENIENYNASYARLEAKDADKEIVLENGDMVSVGQEIKYAVEEYVTERGKDAIRVIIYNPAGEPVGFLPYKEAHHVRELDAAGWTIRVTASAVGYSDMLGSHWIEMAVVAYSSECEAVFKDYTKEMFKRIAKGDRPEIRLTPKQVDRAIADGWQTLDVPNTAYPKLKKGEAYYKRHSTGTEKLVLAGSGEHRTGCTVASVVILVVIVAAIVFAVWKFLL